MRSGHAVYRENHCRGEMNYELTVYAVEGGVHCSFICPLCGTTDQSDILSPQPTEAIRQALLAVDAHHSLNHPAASFGIANRQQLTGDKNMFGRQDK